MIARSSPADIAIVKNVVFQVARHGGPKLMLDTPSTVRTPSFFAAGQRLQRLGCAFLLSAGGQAETVNVDILVRDACGVGGVYNAAGNGDAALHCRWDAALYPAPGRRRQHRTFTERQNLFQRLSLAVDRVDDGLCRYKMRNARERASGFEESSCSGRSVTACKSLTSCSSVAASVDAGQTGVDVQHLGTGLGLGHGLECGVSTVAVT